LSAPPPRAANPPQAKLVDGPVKQVDPLAKTVSVGWLFGLFSTKLEVTEDTHVAVDGMAASLMDIREGDEVKASYEARDGKNIATSIEVTEAEPRRGAGMRSTSPAASNPPSLGAPQGSDAPSTGAPKTP
jgi:Cu/Ag efflux protein CusF